MAANPFMDYIEKKLDFHAPADIPAHKIEFIKRDKAIRWLKEHGFEQCGENYQADLWDIGEMYNHTSMLMEDGEIKCKSVSIIVPWDDCLSKDRQWRMSLRILNEKLDISYEDLVKAISE